MAPDTASRDPVPKEPANLKQEASAPCGVEDKPECMGCRAVAFTTPLLISGYLIHTHSSLEKVAAMPIAKNWTGNRRWRLKLHRFNMVCVVPVWLSVELSPPWHHITMPAWGFCTIYYLKIVLDHHIDIKHLSNSLRVDSFILAPGHSAPSLGTMVLLCYDFAPLRFECTEVVVDCEQLTGLKKNVELGLCYTTYDYLFNGLPSLPGTTTDEVVEEPPKNVEEFVQRTVDYTKNDMDSFTRGTLQLADWFITSMGDRRTDILTAYTRFKRMFSAQSSDKDSENDS